MSPSFKSLGCLDQILWRLVYDPQNTIMTSFLIIVSPIRMFYRTWYRLSAIQISILYNVWIKFYGRGWKPLPPMLRRDKKSPVYRVKAVQLCERVFCLVPLLIHNVSVNSKPDHPPRGQNPRAFLWANSPPPKQKRSSKPPTPGL